jgi:hypothetical protein
VTDHVAAQHDDDDDDDDNDDDYDGGGGGVADVDDDVDVIGCVHSVQLEPFGVARVQSSATE